MKKSKDHFNQLVSIMKTLRAKDGCPWDKKQTHKSITPYLLEEAYEVIEAINNNDSENLKEELGDLLLQVVFHAQIASGNNKFEIEDVIKAISNKLIIRHPHVFGDKKGLTKDWHVRDFWEKQKKESKKRDSVIDGVPKALPALLRSRRLQSKAQSTGFKWKKQESILEKVEEEFREVKAAIKSKNKKNISEELGDLMFALVTLAYHNNINAEDSVQKANDKFIKRFKKIEKSLVPGMSEKDMIALWKKAKKKS
ncbi:MAG: nucleoside triphosphate pyrophosphohydrolase [bacterium]